MIRRYNIDNIVMQEAYNDLITANFDDKNLLEVSARLENFQETTRKMSSNNSLIIQGLGLKDEKNRSRSAADMIMPKFNSSSRKQTQASPTAASKPLLENDED